MLTNIKEKNATTSTARYYNSKGQKYYSRVLLQDKKILRVDSILYRSRLFSNISNVIDTYREQRQLQRVKEIYSLDYVEMIINGIEIFECDVNVV